LGAEERRSVDIYRGRGIADTLVAIIDRLEGRVRAGDAAVETLTQGLAECEVRAMASEARVREEHEERYRDISKGAKP
jgi:hypothetical protein